MNNNLLNDQKRIHSKKWIWLLASCFLALVLSCLFIFGTGAALFLVLLSRSNQNPVEDPLALVQPETSYLSTLVSPGLSIASAVPDSIDEPGDPLGATQSNPDSSFPRDQSTERLTKLNPPDLIDREPLNSNAEGHLEALLSADYPARDYFEVAKRFGVKDIEERTVNHGEFEIGDSYNFWTDQGKTEATLMAISTHAYFWFESSLVVDRDEVLEASMRFEEDYYSKLTDLWGIEWRPGMDNDPRFSILHLANFVDDDELGYFDSGDEYPSSINDASNEQEIVYLNMDALSLGSDIYFATLTHEVQHLIQWNNDPNETAWLNEGLSQLSELLLEFNTVDTLSDYAANPNIQLNVWDYDDEEIRYAHYGAAYLFSVYLWERLGAQAISELAQSSRNGIASISLILEKYLPETNLIEFFGSWTVANYLENNEQKGQYSYSSIELIRPVHSFEIDSAPTEKVDQIEQFSAEYIRLNLRDTINISFVGDIGTELINAAPHSGQQMWFASATDDLDAYLIYEFDLSEVAYANLEFWAWYDLEREYDFAYISVSTDGGVSWELQDPEHALIGEFGPGLSGRSSQETGQSNGWVFESISLDQYTGDIIRVRFDLITDSAIPGVGLAIDDVAVPELGFIDDVETSPDAYASSGFVQTGWRIPQGWSLNIIRDDTHPTISPLSLDEYNSGSWTLDLGEKGAVLVISALAPFSTEAANYWIAVESIGQ
ncbi:MAG: immune inhibitor A [Anaerolineae bacterium]|nr:MAG: immune inhibitor A [Anaerolineae bacterium]